MARTCSASGCGCAASPACNLADLVGWLPIDHRVINTGPEVRVIRLAHELRGAADDDATLQTSLPILTITARDFGNSERFSTFEHPNIRRDTVQVIAVGLAACLIGGAALAQTTGSQPTDRNAAVQSPASTTAAVPARGANSFTEGQAKSRIEGQGYANVSDLRKDDAGVWRGRAQKEGNTVGVWLDYKGTVGQGS